MNELNEQEMEQLERELRSYGMPYDAPEPDERYFANFRARVMERIAASESEPVGFGARMREFFSSPMRLTLVGGSILTAILLYFYLQSGDTKLPVAQDMPQQELIAPERQQAPEQIAPPVQETAKPTESVTAPKPENRKLVESNAPSAPEAHLRKVETNDNTVSKIADDAANFEKIDELSLSDDTEPVSYDKLSVDELEAILKTLESEPLTIQ